MNVTVTKSPCSHHRAGLELQLIPPCCDALSSFSSFRARVRVLGTIVQGAIYPSPSLPIQPQLMDILTLQRCPSVIATTKLELSSICAAAPSRAVYDSVRAYDQRSRSHFAPHVLQLSVPLRTRRSLAQPGTWRHGFSLAGVE